MKKWFKNNLLDKKTISDHSSLRAVRGYLIRHRSLWYLNRYSIARGVAVGLLAAFIPLPMQMLIAVFLAIAFRANVPVAVVLTWVSNPLTFVPLNYFIYFIGTSVLGETMKNPASHEIAWNFNNIDRIWISFVQWLSHFGKAFFIGLPIVAFGSSIIGYGAVMMIWHISRYFKFFPHKK